MTINDILNFVDKYNLSDEARDELITMFVLNDKIKFNTTPYNPKIRPRNGILDFAISSHGYNNNDRLAETLCLKDRNIIDEKIDLMEKGYYSNKAKSKTGLAPIVWRD